MARAKQGNSASATQDAFTFLKDDHRKVQKMFKTFESMKEESDDEEKGEICLQICSALTVHAQIEEEILYPALRNAMEADEDLLDEAEVEHAAAKELISQLEEMDAGDELYDAKLTVLGEYVNHHIEEEEGEIFPKAKKAKVDAAALGEELRSRRDELMAELGIEEEGEEEPEEKRAAAPRRAARGSGSRASSSSRSSKSNRSGARAH